MCSVNLSNFICFGKVSDNTGFRQLMIRCVSEFRLHITVRWMQNKGSVHLIVLVIQFALVTQAHTVQYPALGEGAACPGWPSSICSLNLAGNSAFHPPHPLPSKGLFLPQYWESSFCLARRPHWHCLQFGLPILIQM